MLWEVDIYPGEGRANPAAEEVKHEAADLGLAEMQAVMGQIMTGEATQAQIGGFLMGLRMKGESLDEITGAVKVMRQLAAAVDVSGDHMVDIVGTGGDGHGTYNVSTCAAIVAAGAGVTVAKLVEQN